MKIFKFLAMLLAVICLTFGASASAAENGMQTFRDAYFDAMDDTKTYQFEIMFHGPALQSNIVSIGQVRRDGYAVLAGKLNWAYTDMAADKTYQIDIPIYAERAQNAIDFYGQLNGSWEQEKILKGLTWVLDAVSTDDREAKMQYAAAVKHVEATDAKYGRQQMQIIFDGKSLAEMQSKIVRERIASLPEADKQEAMEFLHYINAAFADNDLPCTWTIEKNTGETVTLSADLTNIMRSYAKEVLKDSYDGKISLTPEETNLRSSLGYYYNLQCYLSQAEFPKQLTVPANVKREAKDSELFQELKREIISAVKN